MNFEALQAIREIKQRLEAHEMMVRNEPAHEPAGQIAVRQVIEVVARAYGHLPSDLVGRSRFADLCESRQVAMWATRQLNVNRFTLEYIGNHFGGRNHGTILEGIRKIRERREVDPAFREKTDRVLATVKGLAPILKAA